MASMEARNLLPFTAVRPVPSHSKGDIFPKHTEPSLKSAQSPVTPCQTPGSRSSHTSAPGSLLTQTAFGLSLPLSAAAASASNEHRAACFGAFDGFRDHPALRQASVIP